MNKQEFLTRLKEALAGLPQDDVAERLSFYAEMIDDRVEDGMTEEDAVAGIGSAEQIAAQILRETPITRLVKERVRPKRRLRAWEIVLLVLGAPIWLSLLLALLAVVFSVYAALWSVLLSLWAVELSLAVSSLGAAVLGVVLLVRGAGGEGLALFGAAFLLAGLSVFLFLGCKAATEGILLLTKKLAWWIKSRFLRKENT